MHIPDYRGWTIRCGFLDRNLGDNTAAARAFHYADELRDALTRAYPGAIVEVPWQRNTSGCLPSPLRPAAFKPDGDWDTKEEERINQIAAEVFEAGMWLED